ncbi:MAG: ABC transporter ATP-binding protein, partial [Myxococcales bacterium]
VVSEIVEIGDAREVFANPQHPYTQELLRSTISLTTTGLNYIPGAPPDLVDPPSGCHFHPRCPKAMSICAERAPHRESLDSGVEVSCWAAAQEVGIAMLAPDESRTLEQEVLADADEA